MTREENCRLSQGTLKNTRKSPAFFKQGIGAVDETRTRDLHLGKVALYQLSYYRMCVGAGDGNRTHVASLEGWNSTIELHPRMRDNGAVDETRTRDLHLGKVALYQLSYYRKTMGDRRRRGKQALMKTGAGEETRTHTPVAPDPKSGASAIPPRPHAAYDPHGASAPDSQIRTLIYYTLCAVACQGGNGNFFLRRHGGCSLPARKQEQAMAEGAAPFVHPLEGEKGEFLPRKRRGFSRAGD